MHLLDQIDTHLAGYFFLQKLTGPQGLVVRSIPELLTPL